MVWRKWGGSILLLSCYGVVAGVFGLIFAGSSDLRSASADASAGPKCDAALSIMSRGCGRSATETWHEKTIQIFYADD